MKIEDGRGLADRRGAHRRGDAEGLIRFLRTEDSAEILAEDRAHFWWPGSRLYTAVGNGHHRLEQRFAAYDDEKLYGLGQHQHGRFDQKGLVLDLIQRNAEVGIPVLTSSRGYTLLWNNPAIGRVELAHNGTRWVADSARQIDYWITAGDPAGGQRRYSAVTGRTPMLPEWAAGFWQCKLRYRTQDELLAVAREYKRRGLPISAIVCDFFHWTHLGDWKFDPKEWPDPAAMVRELEELGIKLVVCVWPSVSPAEREPPGHGAARLLHRHPVRPDGTRRLARQGGRLHGPGGLLRRHQPGRPGVRVVEGEGELPRPVRHHGVLAGRLRAGAEAGLPGEPALLGGSRAWRSATPTRPRTPAPSTRACSPTGEEEIVTLNRSAWAGSQRYGAALWSGDIGTDFPTLRRQIAAGLNTALSGHPVVEHRHRRLPRRRPGRPGLPGGDGPLVPVRRAVPADAAARLPRPGHAAGPGHDRRPERGVVLRRGGRRDPGAVPAAARAAEAVCAGRHAGGPRGGPAGDAAAVPGVPGRPGGLVGRRLLSVRPGPAGRPGADGRRHGPYGVPAGGGVLDGRVDG